MLEGHRDEKANPPLVLSWLDPDCLLVMDPGYFSFGWFDQLSDAGIWWVSRLRQQTSYHDLHAVYAQDDVRDALVGLGAYRADRKHLVRLVEFPLGPVGDRYLTRPTHWCSPWGRSRGSTSVARTSSWRSVWSNST